MTGQRSNQGSRARGARLRRWVLGRDGAGYFRRWIVLAALIGTVAGIGAILFIHALQVGTRFFLGVLAGYHPPLPVGEGNEAGSVGFARPWAVPLVVGMGGLLSGILVFRLAPEAEGHGTDAAIGAVHHNPRGVRGQVTLVKIVASALTIGSGGSGGREGPTAQISAGFASMLARRLELTPADARIAMAVGIGAGIGAIFRAPLGGAVIGAEILYREDVEAEALVPSFIASIVGFSIFGAVEGWTPIFGFLQGYRFTHPFELGYFALLGVAAGLVGKAYARGFYGVMDLVHRLPGPRWIWPATAGALVGTLGLAMPAVLGTGYGAVQEAMTRAVLGIPLWMLLALPFAKILATSLSIGSGGSGGIFGPGIVIGGFLGAALWRLLAPAAPAVPDTPAPFVVVGMIALFGSVSHALLAVLLMVAEMTGSLALLPPAILALGLAALVVGNTTIYRGQLKNRAESPAYRTRLGLPLLATVPIAEAMARPRLLLRAGATVEEARQGLAEAAVPGAPVVDERGRFRGAVHRGALAGHEGDPGDPVGLLVDPAWPAVPVSAMLDAALDALATNETTWVAVIDWEGQVVGIVAVSDLIRGYRMALSAGLRRLPAVTRDTELIEEPVGARSALAGRRLAEAAWPPGTVVLAAQRGSQLLFPTGETVVEPGDVLTLLTRRGYEASVRQEVRGPEQPEAEGGEDRGNRG